MAIFFPPPPPYTGGPQPYGQEHVPPPTEVDNPPFTTQGQRAQQQTIIQIGVQPDPWVYLIGQFGPYGFNKVNPNNLSVERDNPPFTYGGPISGKMGIVAQAQDSPFNYTPWPYQFLGRRQPYGPTQLTPASVDPPPFQGPGRSPVLVSQAAIAAQPDPWVYLITGSFSGPYGYSKLNPSTLAVKVDNPPFQDAGRSLVAISEAVMLAQPDPWVYLILNSFSGPYGTDRLPARTLFIQVDPPPFTYGGPIAGKMAIVEQAQDSPFNYTPWQYQFLSGRQPYGPIRLTPGIPGVSRDPPPFQEAGRSAVAVSQAAMSAQPDPWIYASLGLPGPYGGRIEGIPTGVRVDSPPVAGTGKTPQQQAIFQINQPTIWGYTFEGGFQPYAGAPLEPALILPPPPPPPPPPVGAGKKPTVTGIYPDAPYDKKPNKPFKPVWDYGGEVEKPKAAPAPAVGPRPIGLPPASIYGGKQQRAVPLTGANPLNLPNFDHLVPPNPVGIGNSLKEAQDMTDAVAVLRALGVIK